MNIYPPRSTIDIGRPRGAWVSGSGGFAGAYDAIPSVAAAYGMRRLRSAYTGNLLRLRRDSDNAESDFGYLANGDLDAAAIATWLTATTGYVTTWYDQSGNGNNAVQATAANQPLYVASGQNGKPVARFDGTDDYLSADVTLASAPQPMSFLLLHKPTTEPDDGDAPFSFSSGSTRTSGIIIQRAATPGIYPATATFNSYTAIWRVISYVQTAAASGDALYVNGSAGTTEHLSSTTNLYVSPLDIGRRNVSAVEMDCDIAELIVAGAAWGTAARQAAEVASNAYWGVY